MNSSINSSIQQTKLQSFKELPAKELKPKEVKENTDLNSNSK